MKLSKRVFAIALVLALVLSLSVSAFADGAQYKNTQDFLALVDGDEDLVCEYAGVVEIGGYNYEAVSATYSGDLSDYVFSFVVLFSEDGSEVILNMPGLVEFADDSLVDVLVDVNDFNAKTSGLKLYVTGSNTVEAEMYTLVTEETASEVTLNAIALFMGMTAGVYETFLEYAA